MTRRWNGIFITLVGFVLHNIFAFSGQVQRPKQSVKTSSRISASAFSEWSAKTGDSALRQVQFLASKVAESTAAGEEEKFVGKQGPKSVQGIGGVVYNNPEYNRGVVKYDNEGGTSILNPTLEISMNAKREEQVWTALANLELDSKLCVISICWRRKDHPTSPNF